MVLNLNKGNNLLKPLIPPKPKIIPEPKQKSTLNRTSSIANSAVDLGVNSSVQCRVSKNKVPPISQHIKIPKESFFQKIIHYFIEIYESKQVERRTRVDQILPKLQENKSLLEENEQKLVQKLQKRKEVSYWELRDLKALEVKYFSKDSLMAKKLLTNEKFEKMWRSDSNFVRLKSKYLSTETGRNHVDALYCMWERKEGFSEFERIVNSFKSENFNYKVKTEYYLFSSTLMDIKGSKTHSGLELLEDRGVITGDDRFLIKKFLANKKAIDFKGYQRLKTLNDQVIKPLAIALDKNSYQLVEKVISPSEKKFIESVDFKTITYSQVKQLRVIQCKYLGNEGIYQRKKIAIERFEKLFPLKKPTDSDHLRLETSSYQIELLMKEEIYDRKGVWRHVVSELDDLFNKNEENFLKQYRIFKVYDLELLNKVRDRELSKELTDKERQWVIALIADVVEPILIAIKNEQSNKKFDDSVNLVTSKWIGPPGLMKLQKSYNERGNSSILNDKGQELSQVQALNGHNRINELEDQLRALEEEKQALRGRVKELENQMGKGVVNLATQGGSDTNSVSIPALQSQECPPPPLLPPLFVRAAQSLPPGDDNPSSRGSIRVEDLNVGKLKKVKKTPETKCTKNDIASVLVSAIQLRSKSLGENSGSDSDTESEEWDD